MSTPPFEPRPIIPDGQGVAALVTMEGTRTLTWLIARVQRYDADHDTYTVEDQFPDEGKPPPMWTVPSPRVVAYPGPQQFKKGDKVLALWLEGGEWSSVFYEGQCVEDCSSPAKKVSVRYKGETDVTKVDITKVVKKPRRRGMKRKKGDLLSPTASSASVVSTTTPRTAPPKQAYQQPQPAMQPMIPQPPQSTAVSVIPGEYHTPVPAKRQRIVETPGSGMASTGEPDLVDASSALLDLFNRHPPAPMKPVPQLHTPMQQPQVRGQFMYPSSTPLAKTERHVTPLAPGAPAARPPTMPMRMQAAVPHMNLQGPPAGQYIAQQHPQQQGVMQAQNNGMPSPLPNQQPPQNGHAQPNGYTNVPVPEPAAATTGAQ